MDFLSEGPNVPVKIEAVDGDVTVGKEARCAYECLRLLNRRVPVRSVRGVHENGGPLGDDRCDPGELQVGR